MKEYGEWLKRIAIVVAIFANLKFFIAVFPYVNINKVINYGLFTQVI